ENTVKASFDLNYVSEYLLQAQWAEFIELKKVISEIADRNKRPVTILDIGIGNARIAKHLSGIKDIWDKVAFYDGTDNAMACVEISNKEIERLNIGDKVAAHFLDATDLDKWEKKYDMVITTWFTAGNFYPDDFPFDSYMESGKRLDLTTNKKFDTIFRNAYSLLNPGGEVVIGACYIDNDATRLKQEESYRKMGMTVITDEKDSFTATKDSFWSQRFTKEKLYSYLSFAEPSKISFTPLDTYNYAMQVRIRK
ncbi:MAG: class I SAM-dependent methyltransferase, partial [Chitinophagaceae bacterium]